MRKTADAVVIGGGIVGASTAYYLAKKGLREVVLLEKGEICSGSSGDSAAIVRQHYSNEVSIRLVRRTLEIFQGFADEFDGARAFTDSGWLFLVPEEASEMFTENLPRLKGLGVRTWELSIEDALKELPGLNPEGIARVGFEPDSGYADPHVTANAMVSKAVQLGAESHIHTPATGIMRPGGAVSVVSTPKGDIETEVVVNAAGPWASEVGGWLGLDLPLEISREQDIVVKVPEGAAPITRAVSNMVDRTYFRPEPGGRLLVGTGHPKPNDPAEPDNYNRDADPEFISETSRLLAHRFPYLAEAELTASWAGLYTITPDWSMIVDAAPGLDGVYLAVGGSGHSFKLAPALGECLAEMIVDGNSSTVDITPLRASRFDDKELMRSTYGGNRG
jgi:sarcosine oxidase subunit beta